MSQPVISNRHQDEPRAKFDDAFRHEYRTALENNCTYVASLTSSSSEAWLHDKTTSDVSTSYFDFLENQLECTGSEPEFPYFPTIPSSNLLTMETPRVTTRKGDQRNFRTSLESNDPNGGRDQPSKDIRSNFTTPILANVPRT
jgi:hypothetical protein